MKIRIARAAVLMIAALGLGQCKKGEGLSGPGGAQAGADAKLNAYIGAYNGVMSPDLGLPEQYKNYAAEHVSRASPSQNIVLSPDWVASKTNALAAARALRGTAPALDAAGDRLIGALAKVTTRYDGLERYYEGKKYLDDALANGKAQDAPMLAEFKTALEAGEALGSAISDAQKVREARELQARKDAGDLIGFDEIQAIGKARMLVQMFQKPEDLKDAALFAKADTLVGELEAIVDDERKQLASKPKDPDGHDRNTYFADSLDELTKLTGEYRDLKRTRDATHLDDMVSRFNSAIESMNSAG